MERYGLSSSPEFWIRHMFGNLEDEQFSLVLMILLRLWYERNIPVKRNAKTCPIVVVEGTHSVVKMTFDASIFKELNCANLILVVRNDTKNSLGWDSKFVNHIVDPTPAQALVVRYTAELTL
ncbi:hypothetical protein Salat_2430600 [Sesamum alatum]|uniref:Uncharacterized protein n=1 Tax=Sesamum alatum TaxID=300844 RepID=A0AAE1XYX2_9LAMI|nr:hypothetical protein Salat_2430600 [Sesamum alatum]